MKIRAGIIGASGYTAQELTAILAEDSFVEIVFLKSSSEEVSAFTGMKFENLSKEEMIERKPDVVFFATPHGVAMTDSDFFLEKAIKVIDLSGDFRFKDAKVFEKAYGMPHSNPKHKAVFGLPEIFRKDIAQADLIANPGCYVTSSLLAAFPIAEMFDSVVFDAVSGYSGAGKGFKRREELEKNIILPYNLGKHRHLYEIEQFFSGLVFFTPHVINTFRGIENTAHFFIKPEFRSIDFVKLFTDFYAEHPLVKIQKEIPNITDIQAKNGAILGGFEMDDKGRLIVISCLDNLRKGAASQAVQNLHIMFDLPDEIPEPKSYLQPSF